MRERVSVHEQEKDYSCGSASLKMAYEAFYHYVDEAQIAREMKLTSEGASWAQMVHNAGNNGFSTHFERESSWNSLKYFWKTGSVVVVCYQSGEEENMGSHFSPIQEISDRHISLADPAMGRIVDMKRKDFENRWYDDEGLRSYMAITKTNPNKGRIEDY